MAIFKRAEATNLVVGAGKVRCKETTGVDISVAALLGQVIPLRAFAAWVLAFAVLASKCTCDSELVPGGAFIKVKSGQRRVHRTRDGGGKHENLGKAHVDGMADESNVAKLNGAWKQSSGDRSAEMDKILWVNIRFL